METYATSQTFPHTFSHWNEKICPNVFVRFWPFPFWSGMLRSTSSALEWLLRPKASTLLPVGARGNLSQWVRLYNHNKAFCCEKEFGPGRSHTFLNCILWTLRIVKLFSTNLVLLFFREMPPFIYIHTSGLCKSSKVRTLLKSHSSFIEFITCYSFKLELWSFLQQNFFFLHWYSMSTLFLWSL